MLNKTEYLDRPSLLFARYRFHPVRKRPPFVVQFRGENGAKQMALFHPLNNADKPAVRCSSVNTSGLASTDICQLREALLQASRFAIEYSSRKRGKKRRTNTPWKQFLFISDVLPFSLHRTKEFTYGRFDSCSKESTDSSFETKADRIRFSNRRRILSRTCRKGGWEKEIGRG